jgi:hypothetical protein
MHHFEQFLAVHVCFIVDISRSQKPEETATAMTTSTFTNDLGFAATSPDTGYATLYADSPTVYEALHSPTNTPGRPIITTKKPNRQ